MAHNNRMNPPAGGGPWASARLRSPAAGYAERWADRREDEAASLL